MTPEEKILYKNLVTSSFLKKKADGSAEKDYIDTARWATIPAALRDRAFFSSRVESVRFLATCRDRIAELLAAAPNKDGAVTSRAQVVSDIMQAAVNAHIATGEGGLTDPSSPRRATTIIDTNAGLAAAYCRAEVSNSYGARLAFPAQELVRIEQRVNKRDWRLIWRKHGGKLFNNRMIALKGDPIWVKISRFGVPYPPFDFGSGMGVEDVSREDAIALGVIKEDYTPPKSSPLADFNATLEADLKFKNDTLWQSLLKMFGDQVRQENGKISWRNDLIREAFTSNKPFAIRLGEASPALLSKLPATVPAALVKAKPLIINQNWLNKKRKDGTDHRAHFHPIESHPNDIPLTLEDLELLPDIWRNPEKVEKTGRSRVMLSLKSLNGGTYKAVVDYEKDITLKTLYREGENVEL